MVSLYCFPLYQDFLASRNRGSTKGVVVSLPSMQEKAWLIYVCTKIIATR